MSLVSQKTKIIGFIVRDMRDKTIKPNIHKNYLFHSQIAVRCATKIVVYCKKLNKITTVHKKTREYTYNKNYRKLSQKFTKITFCTTKIVVLFAPKIIVYCKKLTKIIFL